MLLRRLAKVLLIPGLIAGAASACKRRVDQGRAAVKGDDDEELQQQAEQAGEECQFASDTGPMWSRGTIVTGNTMLGPLKMKFSVTFNLPMRFVASGSRESGKYEATLANYIEGTSGGQDLTGEVTKASPSIAGGEALKGLQANKGIFRNTLSDPSDVGCGLIVTKSQTFPLNGANVTKTYDPGVPLFINPNMPSETIVANLEALREKRGADLPFSVGDDNVRGTVGFTSAPNGKTTVYRFSYNLTKDGAKLADELYKTYGLFKAVRIEVDNDSHKVVTVTVEQKPAAGADGVVRVVYVPRK